MRFPYPSYYPNQKETIEFLKNSLNTGKNSVIESPTGSGKTIAVLLAALPFARREGKKILYLCRTHEQMERVITELRAVSKNEQILGLSLKSRQTTCLNDVLIQNTLTRGELSVACSNLKKTGECSYYENLKKYTLNIEEPITASEIVNLCRAKRICPYEFIKGKMADCEVIACSYIYVFDPDVRAAFLRSLGTNLKDIVLILDEAHNLPRLAVDIASKRLTEFTLNQALKEAEEYRIPDVDVFLRHIKDFLLLNQAEEKSLEKNSLINHIQADIETVFYLEDIGNRIIEKKIEAGKRPTSFLQACGTFIRKWIECNEPEYAFFSSKTSRGAPSIEILSLEPSIITKTPLEEAYRSMQMSATMTPINPYCEVVGLSNYSSKEFPSPFKPENIVAYVDAEVTTLGSERTREMFSRIAKKIARYLEIIPGNVLVFFPSYTVLNSVLDEGFSSNKELFIEKRHTTSAENNEMIKRYKKLGNGALFGVQQGRNSEGQDFPGKQANAVIVIGIPYAAKSPKINAQINYYKEKYKGWWGRYTLGEYYAYYLPAYRSLNQSAGRAHRKLSDRGVVIFLERRVAVDKKVRANISPWLKESMKVMSGELIEKDIERFYSF